MSRITLAAILLLCLPRTEAQQSEMGLTPVDGGEIEYVVAGPEDGEAILFIHGSLLADSFLPVMEEPALDGYRRIRIHRRGHAGSSALDHTPSMSEEAADAVAVLDALEISRAHVAGHSYGAAVALQLAVDSPERIGAIVLAEGGPPASVIPPPAPDPSAPMPAGMIELGRAAEAGDMAGVVSAYFSFVFGDDWREFVDPVPGGYEQMLDYAPSFLKYELEGALRRGEGMGAWQAASFDMDAVTQPVLLIWGSESPNFQAPYAEQIRDAFLRAEGHEIAGTDHALIIQKPDEVARAIADFLRQ
jgi:pimeloyl-ACP methyl ester carboxylesterase